MTRLLLDANLSSRTAGFLHARFGLDAVSLMALGLNHLDDAELMAFAIRESRIVVTEDLDFGRLYFSFERG